MFEGQLSSQPKLSSGASKEIPDEGLEEASASLQSFDVRWTARRKW
jgi:hypothetical protein